MDYEKAYKEALERAEHVALTNEHKSAATYIFPELSETEDERIRKAIITHFVEGRAEVPTKAVLDEWIAYLEKQKEQKPAEWSEEERNGLTNTIALIQGYKDSSPNDEYAQENCDYSLDWLKSLRPQPKLEWSEEDKKKFNRIIEAIENDTTSTKLELELISFLESLRPHPHWKPSEEQMNWLETALNLSQDKPRIHGIIESLYEDLKKL